MFTDHAPFLVEEPMLASGDRANLLAFCGDPRCTENNTCTFASTRLVSVDVTRELLSGGAGPNCADLMNPASASVRPTCEHGTRQCGVQPACLPRSLHSRHRSANGVADTRPGRMPHFLVPTAWPRGRKRRRHPRLSQHTLGACIRCHLAFRASRWHLPVAAVLQRRLALRSCIITTTGAAAKARKGQHPATVPSHQALLKQNVGAAQLQLQTTETRSGKPGSPTPGKQPMLEGWPVAACVRSLRRNLPHDGRSHGNGAT